MNVIKCIVTGFFSLFLLSSAATADETAPENLANACAACHGNNGVSPGPIPSINDISEDDMIAMLKAFKSGETSVTMMNRIARGYTDAEIAAIAAYFASMEM